MVDDRRFPLSISAKGQFMRLSERRRWCFILAYTSIYLGHSGALRLVELGTVHEIPIAFPDLAQYPDTVEQKRAETSSVEGNLQVAQIACGKPHGQLRKAILSPAIRMAMKTSRS